MRRFHSPASGRISPSPPLGAERAEVRWGEPRVPHSDGDATYLALRAPPCRAPPSPPAEPVERGKLRKTDRCPVNSEHAGTPKGVSWGNAGSPHGGVSWPLFAVVLLLALGGCGKRNAPLPPPDVPNTYPRTYPSE